MKINDIVYEKILFIHIPKTAGTSISKYLISNNLDDWKRICPHRHDPYFSITKYNKIPKNTYIFSVVRNPFTRTYSYFDHFKRINKCNISFLEFLNFVRTRKNTEYTPWISFPQHYFIADENGKFSLNKIYKFEKIIEIEKDFNCTMFHENKGQYSIDDYYKNYNDNCISLVKYLYYQDFIFFNYSMNFEESIKCLKNHKLSYN